MAQTTSKILPTVTWRTTSSRSTRRRKRGEEHSVVSDQSFSLGCGEITTLPSPPSLPLTGLSICKGCFFPLLSTSLANCNPADCGLVYWLLLSLVETTSDQFCTKLIAVTVLHCNPLSRQTKGLSSKQETKVELIQVAFQHENLREGSHSLIVLEFSAHKTSLVTCIRSVSPSGPTQPNVRVLLGSREPVCCRKQQSQVKN